MKGLEQIFIDRYSFLSYLVSMFVSKISTCDNEITHKTKTFSTNT